MPTLLTRCWLWTLIGKSGLVEDVGDSRKTRQERHEVSVQVVDHHDLASSISSSGKVWRYSLELNVENADLKFSAVGSMEQITACRARRWNKISHLSNNQRQIRNKSNYLPAF